MPVIVILFGSLCGSAWNCGKDLGSGPGTEFSRTQGRSRIGPAPCRASGAGGAADPRRYRRPNPGISSATVANKVGSRFATRMRGRTITCALITCWAARVFRANRGANPGRAFFGSAWRRRLPICYRRL